jgi:hypothetical protein
MFWETSVMHIAPERLVPWPIRAKVAPVSVVVPAVTQVTHVVLEVCALIPRWD